MSLVFCNINIDKKFFKKNYCIKYYNQLNADADPEYDDEEEYEDDGEDEEYEDEDEEFDDYEDEDEEDFPYEYETEE